jgi:hypothetical protein
MPTVSTDRDTLARPADWPRVTDAADDTTPADLASYWLDLGCGD